MITFDSGEARDNWGDALNEAQFGEGVLIRRRGKDAVIAVSVERWNEQRTEMARLKRIIESDRQIAEVKAGNYVDFADIEAEFSNAASV